MLKLQGESREQAKAAFNRGKQADFDLDAAVDQFAQISRGRGPLLQLFLQLQCMAVVADGRIDPAEHAMLVRIAQRLGLTEADVSQLGVNVRGKLGSQCCTQRTAVDDNHFWGRPGQSPNCISNSMPKPRLSVRSSSRNSRGHDR